MASTDVLLRLLALLVACSVAAEVRDDAADTFKVGVKWQGGKFPKQSERWTRRGWR